MAGTLTISTLSDGTNSTSSTNCIQGSAKAWVNFNGTGTPAIRGSYNVSSITDNGVGNYTINFTNALANANYAVSGTVRATQIYGAAQVMSVVISNATAPTTSACQVWTSSVNDGGGRTNTDSDYVCVSISSN